jgi:NitT/TauT family transport system permease protein
MTALDVRPAPARVPAPLPRDEPVRRRGRLRALLPPAGSLAGAVGLWYAVSYRALSPTRRFLLPPPHEVLTGSLLDPAHVVPMLTALATTAQVAGLGFACAAVLGVALGVLMSRARWIERAVYPYAVVLQVLPVLAIAPLIGLWFGFGLSSRVVVCVIIALFPIITGTHFGMRSVDGGLHEVFTLHGATGHERLLRLELRAALPSVLTGLRTASGQVVVGAVIGDMFFTLGRPGIGTLLDIYRGRLQSDDLIAAILLASLFGVAVFTLFSALYRMAVADWHPSGRR